MLSCCKPLSSSPAEQLRRVALIALDQMDDSPLTAAMVTPLLATDDAVLQRTVLEVLARHPGWGKEALGTIRAWLAESNITPERIGAIRTLLIAQVNEVEVQQLIAETLNGREDVSGRCCGKWCSGPMWGCGRWGGMGCCNRPCRWATRSINWWPADRPAVNSATLTSDRSSGG